MREARASVVVGEMAQQLIELKEGGAAQDWDRIVEGMYSRPGSGSD